MLELKSGVHVLQPASLLPIPLRKIVSFLTLALLLMCNMFKRVMMSKLVAATTKNFKQISSTFEHEFLTAKVG
jgi:hypothetical protein